VTWSNNSRWAQLLVRASSSLAFRSRRFARDVRLGVFSLQLVVKRRRSLAASTAEGVTVLIATWNTAHYLRVVIAALRRFTLEPIQILVIDNDSSDDTVAMLEADHPDVQLLRLRRNVGHGLALDAGMHRARTDVVVVLDVDAFPISPHWLDEVIGPLSQGYSLSGASFNDYIHPCVAAMKRDLFLQNHYTFDASYTRRLRIRRRGWPKGWDAGKLITVLDQGRHHHIPVTAQRGPRSLGTVFGDAVYHHFYSTNSDAPVSPAESAQAWAEAVAKYLPTGGDDARATEPST